MNSLSQSLQVRLLSFGLAAVLVALTPHAASGAASPSITTQPQSQSVLVNSNATLTVVASGQLPLSYQWFLNGTPLTNNASVTGTTTPTLTVSTAAQIAQPPGTPVTMGPYSVVVSNSHGTATSGGAILTVLFPPAVTIPQPNPSVVAGNDLTIAASVTGTGPPMGFAWYFNGFPLTNSQSSGTANLILTNVQSNAAGQYQLVVINFYGAVTNLVTLTVLVPAGIATQPADQSALLGSNATFTAAANGTAPLSYAWYFNGTPLSDNGRISGSATPNLRISTLQTSDAGPYQLVVTNNYGSATSAVATLTVLVPAAVVTQPSSQSVLLSSNASFTASATGTMPLAYQWYFNGAPLTDGGSISGSTTSNLNLSNIQTGNAGPYQLVVTNNYGLATSAVVTLTVLVPATIGLQPQPQTVIAGNTATFSTTVSGTQPLALQWFFNGSPLSDGGRITGSASNVLSIAGVQTNDAGPYQLIASNAYGMATSSVASLTVLVPPSFDVQPTNETFVTGSTGVFTADATGTQPLGYQWYFNSTPLIDDSRHTGSLTGTLTISNIQTSDAGNYSVVATNAGGSATSATAVATVIVPPSITLQPKGRSSPLGLPTTFNAFATGTAPLVYQWTLNGTNLPGATGNNYTNPSLTTNDFGPYQLIVTNSGGAVTSSVAMLTRGPVAIWGNNSTTLLPPPGLSNVVAISVTPVGAITGSFPFALALKADGTVVAWGSGTVTNVPADLTNAIAVAAGTTFATAVRSDGSVTAWGSGLGTNVNVLSNVVFTSAGVNHGFGLRTEGTVVEWGATNKTQVPAGLTKVISVADGSGVGAAARADGTVVTWGSVNSPGLPGDSATVTPPLGLSNVVAVAASPIQVLALKSDGTIATWGGAVPGVTNVARGLTNIVAISLCSTGVTFLNYCLALRSNGTVVAWGLSTSGLTNIPAGLSNVVAISAGAFYAMALVSDGSPLILQEPAGGTAFSGNQFTLRATANGQSPLSYSWSLNGVVIPGATNSTLTISNVQFSDAGKYQLTVSNALGTVVSVPAPVIVLNSAPSLLTFPPATNRPFIGSQFSLSAAPVGSGPLQLQWLFNGQNLPGQTNTDLPFARLNRTNAGNYVLIASNSFGAVTSSVALLAPMSVVPWGTSIYGVTNPPVNLSDAVALSLNTESAAAIRADGTVATWGMFGTNVPADVTNIVEVANSQTAAFALRGNGTVRSLFGFSGTFSNSVSAQSNIVSLEADTSGVTFLNPDGTATRILNTGATNLFPQLTNIVELSHFYDGFAALRADGSVFTTGSGTAPPSSALTNVFDIALDRTWGAALKRNRVLQSWGTTPLMTLSNMIAVSIDAGVRSNGTVAAWTWTPNSPTLTNPPSGLASVDSVEGFSTATLALLVPRDFQPLLLPDALDTGALVVSSRGSPKWFTETNITHDGLNAAQSASIGDNTASSMRMWVVGPVTVSFWWKVSSETNHDFLNFYAGGVLLTNISGETGWQQCTLALPPGNQILQWTYAKDSSGSAGIDAGWVDQLVFTPIGPSIISQPASTNVIGGSNVTLNVLATGTPPLAYQWSKSANPLSGMTASSLTLFSVTRTNSGTYSVVVTNAAGSVTSSNATVAVHTPQLLSTPAVQPDGSILLNSADIDGGILSNSDLANLQAQVSSNLVDWVPLPNSLTVTNGALLLQDPGATNSPTRFYRIVESWQ